MLLRCPPGERQQRDIARLFDGRGQPVLVRRAHAGQTPGHDLAALGHELTEQPVIFVVDVGDLFGAELANFLAPEKFASTLARRTAGSGSATAASATEARTVSSSGTLPEGPRWPIGCRCWCFGFFSHNAPSQISSQRSATGQSNLFGFGDSRAKPLVSSGSGRHSRS